MNTHLYRTAEANAPPASAHVHPCHARRARSIAAGGLLAATALGAGCGAEAPIDPGDAVGQATQPLSQCVTFQRGVNGTVTDSLIDAHAPGDNYGASVSLAAAKYEESLLRVDLSSIPSSAVVSSATLKLYIYNANDTKPINFHAVTAPWDEGTVTYSSFRQAYELPIAGSMVVSKGNVFKSVDLTALTQAWVTGTKPNDGVLAETVPQSNSAAAYPASSEADPGLRPSFTVCYQTPDDHCTPNPCQNGGTCVNGSTGYTCVCPPGFSGLQCENAVQVCGPASIRSGVLAASILSSGAVKPDGTLWGAGYDPYGQLGDGTNPDGQPTPVQAVGISSVTAVAAGYNNSFALTSDGTVWAAGWGPYGELGYATFSNQWLMEPVGGVPSATALAAGENHVLALTSSGTVWAWGLNDYGQVGDGTTTQRNTPGQVLGLSGVTGVAGGFMHSLAVTSDGKAWGWGINGSGQLGDGTTSTQITPVQVSGLSGVIAVAGGSDHSLALKSDGTVWAWGWNYYGQLGDGTNSTQITPVQVSGLSCVVAIAAGGLHSLALRSDGTVWAWGWNGHGQLGDGTNSDHATPVQVSGLAGIQAVAAGYHSLALGSDGTVWAWGYNSNGQLGDGTTLQRNTPVQSLLP